VQREEYVKSLHLSILLGTHTSLKIYGLKFFLKKGKLRLHMVAHICGASYCG
jgi:hypothetical protein